MFIKCAPPALWCVDRTALIRSALESLGIGAPNGGSNFEIRPLGIDLVPFEVAAGAPNNSEFSGEIFVN